jgi:hypothetical protein
MSLFSFLTGGWDGALAFFLSLFPTYPTLLAHFNYGNLPIKKNESFE